MSDTSLPKLRTVDPCPILHQGQPSLLLRDPLQVSDRAVVIPRQMAPLLALCDGTREIDALRASLAVRYGLRVGPGVLSQFIAALDDALLLENERFLQAHEHTLAQYRQAPFRPPTSAGRSYPADKAELRCLLNRYLDQVARDGGESAVRVRGLVSPHIDYQRGGPVYAAVWKRAAEATRAADLVVVLGTDHYGDQPLTLTRQTYRTPYGDLPTARAIVDELAQTIGAETAFAGELIHRSEHSIELAAVWLHHIRQGRPCELVPILCGSFAPFVWSEKRPSEDQAYKALVRTLRQVIDGRQALIVAAADLAHVGPAFGGAPQGPVERAQLQTKDEELVERMCAGDAEGFFAAIQHQNDRYNICGLPPIYLALQVLHPTRGMSIAYARCPADERQTSLVSISGIIFNGWE